MKKNKTRIAAVLIFTVAFILGVVLMKSLQTSLTRSTMRLGIDLYPRWVGSQAVLDGQSPYSFETRQRIWKVIYGADHPHGNPFGFYYPPAIVTLIIPFILAGFSVDFAAVLWCSLLWALWFTYLSLWIAKLPLSNQNRKLISVLLLICGLLFRPAFSNYLVGQYSLFCLLALIAAWISYRDRKDIVFGIFASLSMIKPSLTLIPVIFFMIFYYRSLKGFLSFIGTSILLYLPPTLILGWWIPDFLKDISQYAIENSVGWFVGDIASIPGIVWLLLSFFLVILGFSKKDEILALSSSVALSAIFFPHTSDYDLVVFICLIVWLGSRWLYVKKWFWLTVSLFLVLVLFPWISLFFYIQSGIPSAVEIWYRFIWLVYPILVLLSALSTYYLQDRKVFQKIKWLDLFTTNHL